MSYYYIIYTDNKKIPVAPVLETPVKFKVDLYYIIAIKKNGYK